MKLSRLLAVPAFVGALALAQTVGIGPARAGAPQCDHDEPATYNACLTINGTGELNQWYVVAGLDAYMSPRYAQEIIDHGGQFRANLWGDDGDRRTWLAELPVAPDWPGVGETGLGVELADTLSSSVLNEDTDGRDELYAEITYFDYHRGVNVTHRTGTVRGEFAPWRETDCVVVCP